jgi:hypothetical protein
LDTKAKQLIDMIPKTKEELFSYEIDWAVYDKVLGFLCVNFELSNNLVLTVALQSKECSFIF